MTNQRKIQQKLFYKWSLLKNTVTVNCKYVSYHTFKIIDWFLSESEDSTKGAMKRNVEIS